MVPGSNPGRRTRGRNMPDYFGYPYFSRSERDLYCTNDSKWVDPRSRREKHDCICEDYSNGRVHDHTYSYSEFFHFGSRETIAQSGVTAVYNDRLWQWDYKKTERLSKEHIGCRWEHAGRAKLSAFMSAWEDKPVEVVAFAEGCNISNGYPYYILWYRSTPG